MFKNRTIDMPNPGTTASKKLVRAGISKYRKPWKLANQSLISTMLHILLSVHYPATGFRQFSLIKTNEEIDLLTQPFPPNS